MVCQNCESDLAYIFTFYKEREGKRVALRCGSREWCINCAATISKTKPEILFNSGKIWLQNGWRKDL